MLRDELHMMLVEYAEGTLDASQQRLVEEEIKNSPELRRDLQLIRDTLAQLHVIEDREVPSHYFSNFLPRLRKRLERNEGKRVTFLPRWVYQTIPSMAVIVFIGIGIGTYYSLKPVNSSPPMYETLRGMDDTDIEDLLDFYADDVIEEALATSDFGKKNLVSKVLASNFMDENIINDAQLLFNLDDDEIELILKKLNSNTDQ